MDTKEIKYNCELRLKLMMVSPYFFARLMKGNKTMKVIKNPLPMDAELVNTSFDASRNHFMLTFRSDEFDVILEGEVIPFVNEPIVKTVEVIDDESKSDTS